MTLIPSSISPTSFQKEDIVNINNPIFDHKLDLITEGAKSCLKEHLLTKISRENCSVIINYIMAMQTEINLFERYRLDTIHKLKFMVFACKIFYMCFLICKLIQLEISCQPSHLMTLIILSSPYGVDSKLALLR
jgi:hypothetical protein